MAEELIEPRRVKIISCGLFIRDFLKEKGEATQRDICHSYKEHIKKTWLSLGHRVKRHHLPTYHSFAMYFHRLKMLGFVEAVERKERSKIQRYYKEAPPRVYYRLTQKGKEASEEEWRDLLNALYKYPRKIRSAKR